MIRIGHGFDSHRYKNGAHIVIGGVKIPSKKAIVAHSDGDILIHALCDALLGATGKRDMGFYFDSSEKYKNIKSTYLLKKILKIIYSEGYLIMNIDSTIIAEQPRISKYANNIQESLSKILKINKDQINIKSKSNDNLGYIGRNEGIEVHVVLLIEKK